ncbi:class I SAM-dependent methyltransferase [Piscinibacter sakaiensis]|uniref:Glycosyltransferase n=2 Tax=Piscinibacter sakaiensis TaxID=1547922 RepID=A0A0K8P6I6_PISS1|nr:class I SAM-dependent methyltransferase [Piscinibacter sakaiensis]GAP38212.1 glycosyltransferase [Piscinibacter sakaiensis]
MHALTLSPNRPAAPLPSAPDLPARLAEREATIDGLQQALAQAAAQLRQGGELLLQMAPLAQGIDALATAIAALPLEAAQRRQLAGLFDAMQDAAAADRVRRGPAGATAAASDADAATAALQASRAAAQAATPPAPARAPSHPRPAAAADDRPAFARWCPCCRSGHAAFAPFGTPARDDAMCPSCGSLERHRLMQLYFEQRTDLFGEQPLRVLHFAPEACFVRQLDGNPRIDYVSADLSAPNAKHRIDITDIPFADDSFDVVICSHVLEHIPDDHRAMRELRRVLRPSGWALLQVPIDPALQLTYEDPSITDPQERERLFGQVDHVRWYGQDYAARLAENGFTVQREDFHGSLPAAERERLGLMPGEDMYLCTKAA